MTNQELLDYINLKLHQGLSEKKISEELVSTGQSKKDVEESFKIILENKEGLYTNFKKIKKIIVIQWVTVSIFVLISLLFLVKSFSLFDLGLLGAFFWILATILLTQLIYFLSLGAVFLFLINIFRIYKIQSGAKKITDNEELNSNLYKKFNHLCSVSFIVNIIAILISVGFIIYI